MFEGRSDGGNNNEEYFQYEGQQYKPYTTIMGQSGLPLNIPYGLYQYAKFQEDPRNAKMKDALRRGKWTDEEVKLTDRIIETFNAGSLELDPETAGGVTLRSYLSEKLGCDPMRITKKYTGASCLGKRVYHSANTKAPREVVEAVKIELAILEEKFREKLEKNCRDRLGLEADVDKHLRNQVVSTPSIDAMMMQGSSSGARKPFSNMMMQGTGNMAGNGGYWTMPEPMLNPICIQSSSSSSSSSSAPNPPLAHPLSLTLPSPYNNEFHQYECESKPEDYHSSEDNYALKKAGDESLANFESLICSTETALGCEKKVIEPVMSLKSSSSESINSGAGGVCSRSVAGPSRNNKRVVPHFPYSRYHDPTTPVESSKGVFELSASSYYYAPSAQEVEASKVQQQKQQQHHMLILQQQQQQQKQQYYLSLEKSSDLPSIPMKTNLTHCVPTLANIGGVKRKVSSDGQSNLSESQSKMHKIDDRNRNDLPIAAFLKNGNIGNIHSGKVGYTGIQGHGQGLVISVPVVSDMSSNGHSNDDSSGGGSPDATGSDTLGSVCNVSGTNSDEGDTSDDNDYKKVGKMNNYCGKGSFSGSYEKNSSKLAQIICPTASISGNASSSSSPRYHQQNNQNIQINQNDEKSILSSVSYDCEYKGDYKEMKHEAKNEFQKEVQGPTAHDEALLSMMSFFSHCHQVESQREI